MAKRCFDLLVASLLLVMLLPVLLVVALLVLIESGTPIFFVSERTGQHGKKFLMPKVRSMYRDSPVVPTPQFAKQDQHITKMGKVLRRTSLDELPQLWSVIKGDMSLVGPRPVLFNTEPGLHMLRKKHSVTSLKPGITGWAQVNGRDTISMISKVRLDCEYPLRKSIWFDIKVLYLTAKQTFNP